MTIRNFLLALGAFIVLGAMSVSCKKDQPYKDPLTGSTFVGTGGLNNDPIALQFGEDTKLTFVDGNLNDAPANKRYSGTYTISNNIVIGTFKTSLDTQFSFGLALINNGTTLDGTLGFGASTSGNGTITVTKQ